MQFARRDAGRYYLHQIDRDYALGRTPEGVPADGKAETPPLTLFALRCRGAEWFAQARKPRETWKSLEDLTAQLSEFELRYEAEDYDTAAAILLEFSESLDLWGHYGLLTDLHERLQGKIADPSIARRSVGSLGTAYYSLGRLQEAMARHDEALRLARQNHDRTGEGVSLGNLGNCFAETGQTARALGLYEQALQILREVGDRQAESAT
jgi:tetratricopeptide (TPR) repeat protein